MRQDIKIVLEFVPFANLIDMQKKLNQWISTGLMIKFKTETNTEGVYFQIILKKAS